MNILTFDIEDWFNLLEHPLTDNIDNWKAFESRVDRSTNIILDLLDKHETRYFLFWDRLLKITHKLSKRFKKRA